MCPSKVLSSSRSPFSLQINITAKQAPRKAISLDMVRPCVPYFHYMRECLINMIGLATRDAPSGGMYALRTWLGTRERKALVACHAMRRLDCFPNVVCPGRKGWLCWFLTSRLRKSIDSYNDAHHFRAENPLAHLHEAQDGTSQLKRQSSAPLASKTL